MGKKEYFATISSINREEIQSFWEDLIKKDKILQRGEAISFLKAEERLPIEETEDFEKAVEEFTIYNASPISFDYYKMEFVELPSFIKNKTELKTWILQNHKKWSPALALRWHTETIVGGWVAT